MSRSVAWLRTATANISWRQDQALSTPIYILREMGPTGFLLKEEGEPHKFKVFIGDPHSCTCQVYRKEHDLCKHICWVILKRFRIPRENPSSFQLGLVEREINEMLRGTLANQRKRGDNSDPRKTNDHRSDGPRTGPAVDQNSLPQKEIAEDDVCPICQDELLKKHIPVTFCRYGCGNSIHIKCMKVWAEHQRSIGRDTVECPLCRENFGAIQSLMEEYRNSSTRSTRAERLDIHLGLTCQQCQMCPIVGKIYKCCNCEEYCLCQNCFGGQVHMYHHFNYRQKPSERWKPAQRVQFTVGPSEQNRLLNDLQGRELTDTDYELLIDLERGTNRLSAEPSSVPEHIVATLPVEVIHRGSRYLRPGIQCRLCLRSYSLAQYIRRLPCKHRFHKDCIDQWLLHHRATCPLDDKPVYPSKRRQDPAQRAPQVDGAASSSPMTEMPALSVVPLLGASYRTATAGSTETPTDHRSQLKPIGKRKLAPLNTEGGRTAAMDLFIVGSGQSGTTAGPGRRRSSSLKGLARNGTVEWKQKSKPKHRSSDGDVVRVALRDFALHGAPIPHNAPQRVPVDPYHHRTPSRDDREGCLPSDVNLTRDRLVQEMLLSSSATHPPTPDPPNRTQSVQHPGRENIEDHLRPPSSEDGGSVNINHKNTRPKYRLPALKRRDDPRYGSAESLLIITPVTPEFTAVPTEGQQVTSSNQSSRRTPDLSYLRSASTDIFGAEKPPRLRPSRTATTGDRRNPRPPLPQPPNIKKRAQSADRIYNMGVEGRCAGGRGTPATTELCRTLKPVPVTPDPELQIGGATRADETSTNQQQPSEDDGRGHDSVVETPPSEFRESVINPPDDPPNSKQDHYHRSAVVIDSGICSVVGAEDDDIISGDCDQVSTETESCVQHELSFSIYLPTTSIDSSVEIS